MNSLKERLENAAVNTWMVIATDVEAASDGGDIAYSDAVDCVSCHIEVHGALTLDERKSWRTMGTESRKELISSAIRGYF